MGRRHHTPRPNLRAAFLIVLCRVVVRVFMRRVDVTGRHHVPHGRPMILIANHSNGLADPVLLIGELGFFPRFLVAESMWRITGLRALLEFAMCVPVARRRDAGDGADIAGTNDAAFRVCHEVLRDGGRVAIFPEGGVPNDPRLTLPLRTGTARIALSALADGTCEDLVVVPAGITYEERGRFRSQVALQIGAPIEVRPFLEAYRTDEIAAVRALTEAFGDGLTTVTRSHASWREAEVVHAAAEVAVLSDAPDAPDVYARQAVLQRDLGTAIAAHGGDSGMVYKGLEARIDDLRERLEALGTRTPAEVVHLDPELARRRISGLAAASAVLAPIGALGYALNALPAATSYGLGLRITHPAWKATAKGGSAVVTVPATYALEAWLAHRRWGRPGAAAVLVVAPITGIVAIGWTATLVELRRSVRAAGWARRPEPLAAARASRDAVVTEVTRILALPVDASRVPQA
ncbi:MAG: 1-acyl-sn-glycerol-3-phosphate acyltransferase [Actinomycetes bacterium]